MPLALTVKSVMRLARRPVVRGLRGRVDHDLNLATIIAENLSDALAVADVRGMVPIPGHGPLQLLAVPGGRRFLAEEDSAHVVVNADDNETLVGEEADCLCNQSTRQIQ